MMKSASSAMLLAGLLAATGLACAETSSHNNMPGVSYRTLGTMGPDDKESAPSSGASGTQGNTGSGGPSATAPNSTGGSHTPGTSASGQKADCPGAIARSAQKNGGGPSTGAGYALSGPSMPSAGKDCAEAASGASGGSGQTSGGQAPSNAPDNRRGR
ncbi:MAG TPA: hypothetical protein VJ652_18415 [Noviherbaspirillum sp.]|nr:hypothetical protein [Noviherbaspirillum sp.]